MELGDPDRMKGTDRRVRLQEHILAYSRYGAARHSRAICIEDNERYTAS